MSDAREFVWKALADSTRRRLLDLLRDEPRTTGQLCEHFRKLSRYAVMKHLGILEGAGLVIVRREGRVRWNYINTVPIQEIYDRWVSKYAAPSAQRMLELKRRTEGRTNA
jgi:DNA-binding transcriptional ArsR family regulator